MLVGRWVTNTARALGTCGWMMSSVSEMRKRWQVVHIVAGVCTTVDTKMTSPFRAPESARSASWHICVDDSSANNLTILLSFHAVYSCTNVVLSNIFRSSCTHEPEPKIIIIKPHRPFYVHRCGRVAWSVGLSVTLVSSVKTAEAIKMPFGLRTRMGPTNHVLDGVHIPHGKGQF